MVKLGAEYRLLPLTTLHLQVNNIAARKRADNDPRSDLKQTNQVDFTLRSQNILGNKGLDLRFGVINLLGEELEHPSPAGTYPGDYPFSDGAMLWVQIVYQP